MNFKSMSKEELIEYLVDFYNIRKEIEAYKCFCDSSVDDLVFICENENLDYSERDYEYYYEC